MKHAQSKGYEFVSTLKNLKYSKNLIAQDFDSLYDDLDCEYFLNWFCRSLEKENVLSEDQIQYYEYLQATDKTILEGVQLEESLSTCYSPDESSIILEEIRLKALGDYECSLQELETEKADLECLITLQKRTLKWLNGNLNMYAYRADDLKSSQTTCDKGKNTIAHFLDNENIHMNLKLLKTRESLEHLASSYSDEGIQALPPMLLSKMVLSQYVRLEEQCVEALAEYTKLTMQYSENSEAPSLKESPREVLECCMENSKKDLQQELHQLKWGHFGRLQEQSSTQAALYSFTSALHWAEKALDLYRRQLPVMEEHSFRKETGLQALLEEDVAQLTSERLLPLLQASSSAFSLPVLLGHLDTEDVRLQYVSAKQQDVQRQLLKQWARLDLLTLGLDVELRDHSQTASMLDEFQCGLRTMVSGLHDRLAWMGNLNILDKRASSKGIPARDHTFIRLWELLADSSIPEPLHQKYESLEAETKIMEKKLGAMHYRLQYCFPRLSSIEFISRELLCLMYNNAKNPLVKSMELSEPMEQLHAAQELVTNLLQEMKNGLEEKHRAPMFASLHKERELYVHFFLRPECLVQTVEEQERAAHHASGKG